MRALLFLVALVLAAAPAVAQEGDATNATGNDTPATGTDAPGNETGGETPAGPQSVSLTLLSQAGGGAYWWVLEGQTARNPTLAVPPGAQVTITIKNADNGYHNLRVRAPVDQKTADISATGDTQTITFTAPTEIGKEIAYLCEYHATTMAGILVVGDAPPPPAAGGGEGDSDINGPSVPLGQLIDAQSPCDQRAVPAAVADEVIGGPTAADYLERCRNPNAAGPPAVEPHAADYVIPVSWALIGLGVVGVVWVHRFYKP